MDIQRQSTHLSSSLGAVESCPPCRELLQALRFKKFGYKTCDLEERTKFKESKVQGCQLCLKIFDFLEMRYGLNYDEARTFRAYVYESFWESDKRSTGRNLGCFSLIYFDWNRNKGDFDVQPRGFALWANEEIERGTEFNTGGEPSSEFVNCPPIFSNDPGEFSGIVRRLLNNCLNHHDSCILDVDCLEEDVSQKAAGSLKQGPVGETFELPSRVLCVKDDVGADVVKLVETQGSRGTYCALSHCWGPKNKRPLNTTHENLRDHLIDIRWSNLPKTFQDAIELTRSLGIKYLWIDSLCIIQDDDADWKREARKMASVYQRAILVIDAADAHDSTDGLFLAKRPKPQTVRLPILTADGPSMETWHVAEVSHGPPIPIEGPLRERGWALQEWYLGRRIVFFTSNGIRWKCEKEEMNELGDEDWLRLYENDNWVSCLEIYSQKQLTVPSDRIPALLDIVSQLRKTRNDSFREDVGTWEDELAEQLLWRQLDEPRDQLELPSWCWAAAGGKKLWLFKLPHLGRLRASFHGIAQTVKLSQSQSVNASGHLMPVTIGPQRLEKCCIENLWRASSIQTGSMLRDWRGVPESDQITRFPVCDLSEEHAVLGLAVLDIGSSRSEYFCFVLGSKPTGTNQK